MGNRVLQLQVKNHLVALLEIRGVHDPADLPAGIAGRLGAIVQLAAGVLHHP